VAVKVDQVVAAYITLRNQKDRIEAETKEKVRGIKEKMIKLEGWLMRKADEQGVSSFKTDSGTAFVTSVDFAQVADWDEVLEFVKAHEAYDMLERRVSKRAVRDYIESNKAVPPGVNYGSKLEVNVRKPTKKYED
jgi:hypothetical protein